jgi:hypothetical protein
VPNPEVCATYFAVGALTWIDATFDPLSAPKTDPNSRVVCSAPFQVRGYSWTSRESFFRVETQAWAENSDDLARLKLNSERF